MPGLLRGVARTAVVAGTATAVSNRVSRRQARRWGAPMPVDDPNYGQPAYAEPPPPAAPEQDPVTQLRELAKLRDDGILRARSCSSCGPRS